MPINEDRIHGVACEAVELSGQVWDELSAIQQYLALESVTQWEILFQSYNARHNIVEAQVDDSIFGIGEDESEAD